jgi:hypothetical protein
MVAAGGLAGDEAYGDVDSSINGDAGGKLRLSQRRAVRITQNTSMLGVLTFC